MGVCVSYQRQLGGGGEGCGGGVHSGHGDALIGGGHHGLAGEGETVARCFGWLSLV
jgi:hypothetical protein